MAPSKYSNLQQFCNAFNKSGTRDSVFILLTSKLFSRKSFCIKIINCFETVIYLCDLFIKPTSHQVFSLKRHILLLNEGSYVHVYVDKDELEPRCAPVGIVQIKDAALKLSREFVSYWRESC